MPMRLATLDDTAAISALFCSTIDKWQRMDASGHVHDLDYADLSIYERWLHGGAWLSIETAAIWLSHLLRGAGLPYVLDNDDGIVAYVELCNSYERTPFNKHLHIGQMVTTDDEARDALVQFALEQAKTVGRLTVSSSAYDEAKVTYFKRYGFNILEQTQRLSMSATSGNVGFYKVTDHPNDTYEQIAGWQMPIGRTESAAFHWQQLWADLWHALPQVQARRTHRVRFNVAGQDAFVCLQQQLYDARAADVYCWTPKKLSTTLVGAIRDRAYREGYRTLTLAVDNTLAATLISDAEKTPYQHVILARDT